MRRKLAAVALAFSATAGLWVTAPTPAQACGYEDPVCDVVVYVIERVCNKYPQYC